jgi:hypothetical protein
VVEKDPKKERESEREKEGGKYLGQDIVLKSIPLRTHAFHLVSTSWYWKNLQYFPVIHHVVNSSID